MTNGEVVVIPTYTSTSAGRMMDANNQTNQNANNGKIRHRRHMPPSKEDEEGITANLTSPKTKCQSLTNGNRNGGILNSNDNYDKLTGKRKSFSRFLQKNVRTILPSTYLKWILPSRCYRWACYGSYLFWFTIGLLVLRKTQSATKAVYYVKEHGHTVSLASIEQSESFARLITDLDREFDGSNGQVPAFFLLNQYALNMTFNFLCNTAIYPGVHDRFVFVTLDSIAHETLKKHWPNIKQFYWPTPSLYVSVLKNNEKEKLFYNFFREFLNTTIE